MGKYRDINTGKEYDEIPKGKVQPLIVNGQAVTEEAHDKYYDQHPTELEEVVVTPEQKGLYNPWEIPVFSKQRTESQRRHPRAVETAGSSLGTTMEFIDVNLPWLKVTRPTWWASNIAKGRIANPFNYNEHDNGIFDFPALQQYANEWYTPWINAGFDLGITYGGANFLKWANTSKSIQGIEGVTSYKPLSPFVEKVIYDPTYQELKNSIPTRRFLKSKYIGTTSEGFPKYRQLRVIPSKKVSKEFYRGLAKDDIFPTEVDGYDEVLAFSPSNRLMFGDFEGNTGVLPWFPFKQYAYDFAALPPEVYTNLKEGGKITNKKLNNYVF